MLEEVVFEAFIKDNYEEVYVKDDQFINGTHSFSIIMNDHVPIENSMVSLVNKNLKLLFQGPQCFIVIHQTSKNNLLKLCFIIKVWFYY